MYIRIALISIVLSGIYMPNMLNAQYRFSDQEFPVYTKKVDGIIMKYSGGLVAFTLKSKADEGDLQFLTTKLKGKILRSWSPSGTDELDVTMQIPFNSDPFTVVEELKN